MSIISAGTSNTTSIVYTGDTTGNLVFQTNGTTEAMRITSAQQVGIGTNNPNSYLHINHSNSAGGEVRLQFTDVNSGFDSNSGVIIGKKITNEAARTNDTTNRTNAAAARTNAIKTKKIIGLRAFFLKVVRFMGKLFC